MGAGVAQEKYDDIESVRNDVKTILEELLAVANLKEGDLLVVGCSTSEITGHGIGSYSAEDVGKAVAETILSILKPKGIYLAAQCCEHLNRALIVEREYAEKERLPIVNVRPVLKAGGSFATAAFGAFSDPVALEEAAAAAGMDIGSTLIGMHLRPVAVPVRTKQNTIGSAYVVCARTRPKYIGGERAQYV
ncbi:MAG: TIGR01440 family protein [Lachnospiraceae bacterium]|nr:TIGR01440 family protein [Lachnospiraceae bacterium]